MVTADETRGKRTDALANHARILVAARAVLAERGMDMEVNEVAARAGVGVGTLYRHFANRDAMLRAILTQTFEEVRARIRTVAAIDDPDTALRGIPHTLTVDQSVFAVLQDPRSTKLMQDVKQLSHPVSDEIIALVAAILERGMQAGTFRPDLHPQTTAVAILGSIGAVFENFGAKRPLDELASLLADLHSAMVTAPRPASPIP